MLSVWFALTVGIAPVLPFASRGLPLVNGKTVWGLVLGAPPVQTNCSAASSETIDVGVGVGGIEAYMHGPKHNQAA